MINYSPYDTSRRGMSRGQARFFRTAAVCLGVFFVLIALIVFLSQGSEIQARAQVLSQQCYIAYDEAAHQNQTLCNLSVQFTARSGQVITTTMGGVLQSEITNAGIQPVIEVRYDADDPGQPLDEDSVMSLPIFIVLMVLGSAWIFAGGWPHLVARAFRRVRGIPARRSS
jgi:hypothetical protein